MKQKKTLLRIVSMVLVLALVFAYSPVAVAKKVKKPTVVKLTGTVSNASAFSNMKPEDAATITLKGLNVKQNKLKYKSNKPAVCTVTKSGKVRADHPGSAVITITSRNSLVKGSIKLNVTVAKVDLESVQFATEKYYYDYDLDEPDDPEDPDTEDTEVDSSDPNEEDEEDEENDIDPETLDIGEETEDGEGVYKLITTPFQITDNDLKKFEWTSSNPSVGTVNKNGRVTFYGQGTTIITATYKTNTKLTASIEITAGPSKGDPDDEESDPDDPEE